MRAAALALGVWCAACALLAAQTPNPRGVGKLTVDVLGLESSQGRVFAAVFCSKAGFPSKHKLACASRVSKIVNKRVQLVFEGVPAGSFALTLFHDENGNNTLDTNLFGIPSEGWATSRDAKAHFGPPDFEDARMSLAPDERKHIAVHMQY